MVKLSETDLQSGETMPKEMLIGNSAVMQALYKTAKLAARSNSTILITGENGTGKELLARDIHNHSARSKGPFIAVNCSSFHESLLDSELFGHEKGSFTDADFQHFGIFEQASGGTIFLDEIGETSSSAQAKLLRVLESREIRRVGGTKGIKIDIRVLSATNSNIGGLVAKKKFREDLYYRINVIELCLPSLRERVEDIPILANHFRELANRNHGRNVKCIDDDALAVFDGYPWPGNIRELRNTIDGMVVLSEGEEIDEDDIPSHIKTRSVKIRVPKNPLPLFPLPEGMSLKTAKIQYLKYLVEAAVKEAGGNITKAARMLKTDRKNLYNILGRKTPIYEENIN